MCRGAADGVAQAFCELGFKLLRRSLGQFPLLKLVTNSANQRDIERQRADIGKNRHCCVRLCCVPNSELIKDIWVGKCEIGDDKLR